MCTVDLNSLNFFTRSSMLPFYFEHILHSCCSLPVSLKHLFIWQRLLLKVTYKWRCSRGRSSATMLSFKFILTQMTQSHLYIQKGRSTSLSDFCRENSYHWETTQEKSLDWDFLPHSYSRTSLRNPFACCQPAWPTACLLFSASAPLDLFESCPSLPTISLFLCTGHLI